MRIAGVNIPDNKKIVYALPYIYGIGLTVSKKIIKAAQVDADKLAKDLSVQEVGRLREIIEKSYKIEGDLRREVAANIKRLRELNAYRGLRHMRGLPVRGQRTKTNSRTRRGNVRKTMGSGRKSATSPT
ncbi:MAG: 30S ribosomal protein S13 [Candidatus Sungbacteria bacterium RIFCSPLOWO2_02_FULL_54_10]|uniref:Small ribosomal subunit protein uS13 n=2 Tax=Candidatus Sungiibacteriota TaxID=1817917 RepID=A0A1G2L7A4_9BACT|nr:MAG: 30S ribosomal protein S13 [Candidatus Sungbacteria bacterium RIFCSPHIGHO2_01_FULL_54_26]OHA03640.1 MAG: 30S ribosomal protein S13 [Candidatus Sungbacteria bacterium RIFCSPHIGHO2_02_FULL_53_17]OHA06702.1 MAG: 30S ribosomal protein S13 [Candidatus Sungbacteria bacterium RIFCSPLOWO2_01_FULL_54_21]OHA12003.1 MAG: 30S ribosomal protein S13 [Candidatus Sungbacteria bacterium RIFCSPLOWO2_02_FULL_54_10]